MKLLRLGPAISLAVIATVLTLSAPARADSSVLQPFKADSGDGCPYGYTEGYLNWRYPQRIDVRGTLIDRPTTADSVLCVDDGYYSVTTFTAYRGHTVVDQEQRRANNEKVSFGFTLSSASYQPIDFVVVRVCRHPIYRTTPPSYCGPAVVYRPPVTAAS